VKNEEWTMQNIKTQKQKTGQRTTSPTSARAGAGQATEVSRPNGVEQRTFVRMKKIFGWL
jgi:hypothetical protein